MSSKVWLVYRVPIGTSTQKPSIISIESSQADAVATVKTHIQNDKDAGMDAEVEVQCFEMLVGVQYGVGGLGPVYLG